MIDKQKLSCIMIVIVIILTECYGRGTKVKLYDTLAELKEKEDIEFIDFHDPLVYLLEDRLIHLSEYNDLCIVVPPRNEEKSCWFSLSKEDELLYVQFIRNGDIGHSDGIKYINNHEIKYLIEGEERLFVVFDINDDIKYEIIVYHYKENSQQNKYLRR